VLDDLAEMGYEMLNVLGGQGQNRAEHHITNAHLPLGGEAPEICLSHRVFGSRGLEKGLGFGHNPRIDFCSDNYLVDCISDLCTDVVSAGQVAMHTDIVGSSLTSG
jgi:hypothetical protein